MRRPVRSLGVVGLVTVLGLVLAGSAGAQTPTSLLAQDGQVWRGLSEPEKLALLTGFLIGAAFEQGLALAPGAEGPAPEALEALRREGRLRFVFAPTVYKARLEDFYFYQDRLPVAIYRALFLVNDQIRRGARPGR